MSSGDYILDHKIDTAVLDSRQQIVTITCATAPRGARPSTCLVRRRAPRAGQRRDGAVANRWRALASELPFAFLQGASL